MLRVYVLFNDCPPEFGEKEILAIFMTSKAAKAEEHQLKKEDSYTYQYVVVFPHKVTEK